MCGEKAVLVAIAIPIFTTQLEKAREAVDLSNARAAYAEVMSAALTGDKKSDSATGVDYASNTWSKTVTLKQTQEGWKTDLTDVEIGGIKSSDTTNWTGTPNKGGSVKVEYTADAASAKITWSGAASGTSTNP